MKKLFIANRGEILRRIAFTAKKLGIQTGAIAQGNSEPDYLRGLVDTYYSAAEDNLTTYLSIETMIAAAKAVGADAIHPGFGFLSENPEFSKQVEDAGLIFVGPKSQSIYSMGNKAQAKIFVEKLNIPCVASIQLEKSASFSQGKSNYPELEEFLNSAQYPLLVKAVMGGGGKGLRIVQQEPDLEEAIRSAKSEALNAFGDETLLIEEYVDPCRHVEVQILSDHLGQTYIIGERECSIQRRHQKIIEECPAQFLSDAIRKELHTAAYRICDALNYRSAGTVEFIVKPDSSQFYFLEMNTRLQVEHPVTEQVFQLDLVEQQLKIAQNIPLNLSLKPQGHAIEVRLYAEDWERNFLPAPGSLHKLKPFHAPYSRFELGVDSTDTISQSFDPMIGKVISWGDTRDNAIAHLKLTLKNTFIATKANNKEFLLKLLGHSEFIKDNISTQFLKVNHEEIEKWKQSKQAVKSITAPLLELLKKNYPPQKQLNSQEQVLSAAFQKSIPAEINELQRLSYTVGPDEIFVQGYYKQKPFSYLAKAKTSHNLYILEYDCFQFYNEKSFQNQLHSQSLGNEKDSQICSPVPGKIVRQMVKEGDAVSSEITCFILESMKMEFNVTAPLSGKIKSILVQEQSQVEEGQLLATVE